MDNSFLSVSKKIKPRMLHLILFMVYMGSMKQLMIML